MSGFQITQPGFSGGTVANAITAPGFTTTAGNSLTLTGGTSGTTTLSATATGSNLLLGATSVLIGGSTNSFPMLVRSASGIDVKDATGAAYTAIGASTHYLGNGANGQWGVGGLSGISTAQFGWVSGSNATAAIDSGVKRFGAAIVGPTNGSTGGGAFQFIEMTAPSAPATNNVILYAEDNGSGKTRLMALFPTGAAQQVAIEP